MLSISYKIWITLGFMCPQDRRRYLFLTPPIIVLSLQFSYLLFSGGSLLMVTIDLFLATLHFNCIVSNV